MGDQRRRVTTLDGDAVEVLVQIGHPGELDQSAAAQFVLRDYGGHQRCACCVAGERPQQCHVVELSSKAIADPELLAPEVERGAHLVVTARQQQRHASEVIGEVERCRVRSADQADRLAGDAPAPPGVARTCVDALVAEHQIDRVEAQPREEFWQAARDQHKLDVVPVEYGPDKVLLEVARRGCDGPDAQNLTFLAPTFTQLLDELVARREDAVGVGESDLARLAEGERATGAMKERLAEIDFELFDLSGQR